MHIYDIMLNKSFLNILLDYYENIIVKDSFTLFSEPTNADIALDLILKSLHQDSNVFIELDFANKSNTNFINYFTAKTFLQNITEIKLTLSTYIPNNIDTTLLSISYKKNNKIENGYLLHFGMNTFVILKNLTSNLNKRIAFIPLYDYNKNIKHGEKISINHFKRIIIDIFNNQIISDHQYKTKTIFINDNRELKPGIGKFEFSTNEHNTEYYYKYEDDSNSFIYNFICLTDGELVTNFNLKNYLSIGTLIEKNPKSTILKEIIKKDQESLKQKVTFNLDELNITNIDKIEIAFKLLGLEHMCSEIFKSPDITKDYMQQSQKLIELLRKEDIDIAMFYKDFETIVGFLQKAQTNPSDFVYKNKVLYKNYLYIDTEGGLALTILKILLRTIINERFLQNSNDTYLVEEYIPTNDSYIDERVKNIVNHIKYKKNCYEIKIDRSILHPINIEFQPNDFIYYIKDTNELILVHGKQLYTILSVYNGTDCVLLYPLITEKIPSYYKNTNNTVYKVYIDKDYLKFKSFLENIR